MSVSTLHTYIQGILTHVPCSHWMAIGLLSIALTLYLLIRKKFSVYGAIALSISVFFCLFLLDIAVVIRYCGEMHQEAGYKPTLELSRLYRKSGTALAETVSNIVAFIPFGFFISEFLASAKRFSAGRRLGLATLAGFGLSLCIECLQLLLRVGFFELTDLVMNTLGAFFGASIAAIGRALFSQQKNKMSTVLSI